MKEENQDGGTVKTRVAHISACGRYRYSLERGWGPPSNIITWIMLNPSTADADHDDPTIRRCMGFSRAWGFPYMVVVNLFAWRATDPADMKRAVKPIGPDNDQEIMYFARVSQAIVAAWGAHGEYQERGKRVLGMLGDLPVSVLGLTAGGQPKHPLYVPAATVRIPWRIARGEQREPQHKPPVTSKLPQPEAPDGQ